MNESSHWYNPKTGKSCHELPKKSGDGFKKTTLRDGKELGLFPSVTTVLKILDKPELKRWAYIQIATAALTIPHKEGESNEDFINRIIVDAFEQVDDAASLGTSVHAAVENYFQGLPWDQSLKPYIDSVQEWVTKHNVTFLAHESRSMNHELGVAGTYDALVEMDHVSGYRVKALVDFKTRKTKEGVPCKPWATEPMQLAAYCATEGVNFAMNVFISTTEQGRLETAFYDHSRLKAEYECFKHIVAVYRHMNNFPYTPPNMLTHSTF